MSLAGFAFTAPQDRLEFTGERIHAERRHRYLFALKFCEGLDVLDVAAGEGYGASLLATVARTVIGVDIAQDAVDHANRNYGNDRLSYRQGAATALPVDDQAVDVIVSFETLEHLTEHDRFLGEIRRVLRPGGVLIMSSPDREIGLEGKLRLDIDRAERRSAELEKANKTSLAKIAELERTLRADRANANAPEVGFLQELSNQIRMNEILEGYVARKDSKLPSLNFVRRSLQSSCRSKKLLPFWLLLWIVTGTRGERLDQRATARIIAGSGSFSPEFYYHQNPDIRVAGWDAIWHYVLHGAREGRDPSPSFKSKIYLDANPDVREAGFNPLAHWLLHGAREGRPLLPPGKPAAERAALPATVAEMNATAATGVLRRADSTIPVRIAVVLHLYYHELWSELRSALFAIPEPFDLFVTVRDLESYKAVAPAIMTAFPQAVVSIAENRGRDIGPFVALLRSGLLDGYGWVLKLHSKRSLHRIDGDAWRRNLVTTLVGNRDRVANVIAILFRETKLGLVGPSDYRRQDTESWGSNRERVNEYERRMGLPVADRPNFFAGSMFWFRPEALKPLIDVMGEDAFEDEAGQIDGTLAHAIERLFIGSATAAGYDVIGTEVFDAFAPAHTPTRKAIKVIAFYLPQFHPIPENDRWWGAGFTEWRNVVRAEPSYPDHYQPKLPADLGFYDLRAPEVRIAQAELARSAGIHGFCYYYYWFGGRRLLERPLNDLVASGRPDLPFCICWANENWTRRWDGLDSEVLMEQTYSGDMAADFISDVIPMLRDPRYIRFDGKPVLVVYAIASIPNLREMTAIWRRECAREGVGDIHLCAVRQWDANSQARGPYATATAESAGFDAEIDFPPFNVALNSVKKSYPALAENFGGDVYDYRTVVSGNLMEYENGYPAGRVLRHRGLFPGWDNTARRGRQAYIFHGATPELYEEWLTRLLDQELRRRTRGDSLVFVNAWNEWAEGAVLEPDQRFGHGFLDATARAIAVHGVNRATGFVDR
jgi:lipopolysaccharide biosynthesis protein/ubiquinone/menaquinone biosynthesis C-methylase UbiE